jgi:hypothetical protein
MSIKQILKGGIPIDPFLAQIILTNMVKKPQKLKTHLKIYLQENWKSRLRYSGI